MSIGISNPTAYVPSYTAGAAAASEGAAGATGDSMPTYPGTLDQTKLPLSDRHYSYNGPLKDNVFIVPSYPMTGIGAQTDGPWIDAANNTYDATKKVEVEGSVAWEGSATMTLSSDGTTRTIQTNNLPETTGQFPIEPGTEAHKYDTNPNGVAEQNLSVVLPANPVANERSAPLNPGAIGFVYSDSSKTRMVALYAPLDQRGNNAVAHETQDHNDGHPDAADEYHFHSAPEAMKNSEGVIGYAIDGFEIRGSIENGKKVTNDDLDENHGKFTTNPDGSQTYAYYATDEFPYTIGAFKGTPSTVVGEPHPEPRPPAQPAPPTQPATGTPPISDEANGLHHGTAGNDVIAGGARKDRLWGHAGADTLSGGAGADRIKGGSGADVISGNAGNDSLFGGKGADKISGGAGSDKINGGKGHDTVLLAGDSAHYKIARTGKHSFEVRDAAGHVDKLENVESLQFAHGARVNLKQFGGVKKAAS